MSYLDILENDYPGSEAFLESCLKPVFGTAQKTRLSVAAALSDSEKSIIKDIFIFGRTDNFVLNDMNFFDVTVQDGVDIARSRVMIQRAVRKSLDVYQAAIVLFHHSDNAGLWRFSFIYKEASAKDATSARRYSYLCGKEQHCRTAADNLEKLEKIPGKKKLEDVTTVFSIEALTEDFFKRLFKWYDTWALDVIRFPAGKGKNARLPTTIDDAVKKENRQHLIRLITRLIFVWFLKHKEELIPGWIFDIRELKELIHHFDEHDDKSGAYYNAVLQNLFFAILNCEISKRRFFDDKDGRDGYSIKAQFRDHVDKPMIKIPHSEFIKKFETTPFLNGGLFECLDHREGHEEQEYKDGFSRESKRAAFVPNCLFFGDDEHAGEGIINIFSEYNFTIEENTPHDIEVALDPELLGKVFENLLGTYNEETAGTARKESGSFYTPREIVDYMVDASLKEYFKTKLNMPPPAETDKNLDGLFSRSIEGHGFSQDQTTILIEAIYHCRILDPACGSGAFPMGVLNKLVLILEKLDPENSQWKEIQIQKAIKETEEAYRTGAEEERKERLRKVQEVFEQSTGRCANYARKLYLIENGIYGVDVQPIAIQISKLRFFISLIVDQKTGGTKTNNYNVLPLPNLETKFVAANTLIGIKRIQEGYQHEFADPKIEEIQKELLEVRHKHFSPRTVKEKERLRKEDSVLSKELSALLKKDGFYNASDAQKMADWNPYGQTKSADFFDAWWMFGIKDGFDVVIGNPPYIDSEMMLKIGMDEIRDIIRSEYQLTKGNWDIYIAFFEKGFNLLKESGALIFITPDKWLTKSFGDELRRKQLKYLSILFKSGRNVFKSVGVDSIVTLFGREKDYFQLVTSLNKQSSKNIFIQKNIFYDPYQIDIVFSKHLDFLLKITQNNNTISLLDCVCENACATSDAYLLKDLLKDNVNSFVNKDEYYKVINTGTINKYDSRWGVKNMKYLGGEYLYPVVNKNEFHKFFSKSYGQKPQKSKIIIKGLTLLDGTLDIDGDYIPGKTTVIISSKNKKLLKLLASIINSKLAQFYITERYSASSYNGGVNFTTKMIMNLPIPDSSILTESPIVEKLRLFIDQILAAKAADPQADVSALERQIDALVYRLYNLTYDEVKVIEPEFPLGRAEYEGIEIK